MGKSTKSNITAEAELDPLIDSSQSLPTRNSSFKTPLKLLVKCGLVLLAIAYAERLRLPQAIDVYIRYHEHLLTMNVDNYAKWQQQQSSVGNQAKHPQPAPEVDDHEVEIPNDPYGLNPDIDSQLAPLPSTYKVFEPTDFDDDAFLKSYTCNASYGYNIQMIHRDPLMMRLENFFSSEETDHLKFIGYVSLVSIKLWLSNFVFCCSYPLLHRSTVVGKDGGLLHQARTSSSAFLSRAHDPVVACIEQRVSALTKVPALNIEPLQVLRYIHGQKYRQVCFLSDYLTLSWLVLIMTISRLIRGTVVIKNWNEADNVRSPYLATSMIFRKDMGVQQSFRKLI